VSIDEIGLTGFGVSVDSQVDKTLVDHFDFIYYLVWFAAMDERESCAKVCDAEVQSRQEAAHRNHGTGTPAYGRQMAGVNAAKNCAAAIRARSNVQQEPQK
jgi:hypothetical protein